MDDPKKFVLGKFWENVSKWSNSQSYHEKVIFEDFLIFSPAVGHPGSTLRKILEDVFKKSQVRNSHYLFWLKFLHTYQFIHEMDHFWILGDLPTPARNRGI